MTAPATWRRVAAAPRSGTRRARLLYTRAPLRVKLVATLLLLVVVALAGSGIAATTVMRSYLIGRVDSQLQSVAQRPDVLRDNGVGDPDGDNRSKPLPSAYVVEVTDDNGRTVVPVNTSLVGDEPLPNLPTYTGAESRGDGAHLVTVGAVHGGGQWRVFVQPVSFIDGTQGTLLVAQSLGDVENTVHRLTVLLLLIGAAAVVVVAGVGYMIVRASLRPLREVERTAAAIAGGDLSQRVPDGDPGTEIGQLSDALNTMLGRIETAFAERTASEDAARRSEEQMRISESAARQSEDRMRRFVADASHELRTPLTSIRGFAELYRQGAVADDGDVRRLMQRIEDEAKRMGLLVEDLLMLARMDQERPLAHSPVDLLAVVGDAVHDARAVAPDRPISLDISATGEAPIIIGDESRLRQVLGNLMSNALRHTPPGTPVDVRLETRTSARTRRPVAVVTVADHGPGMSTEAAGRVFERFYRAEASRNRNDGGTGLGLAIVAALVAAHGGVVDVDTAPGRGASFRIEFPLAPAFEQAAARAAVTGPAATDS